MSKRLIILAVILLNNEVYSFMTHKTLITNSINKVSIFNKKTDISEKEEKENKTEPVNDDNLLDKYSEWFGLFPKEKRWKNVRFTVYSFIAGYLLSEFFSESFQIMNGNVPIEDFFG